MKLRGIWKNLAVVAVVAVLASCGKAKYQKQEYQATATAGQYVYTKPKIDILIFQDNSASMISPIQTVKGQLINFLNNLNSNWDFHFTVLPLQSTVNLNSKYIVAQDCSSIFGGACLTPAQSSYFNSDSGNYGWINSWDYNTGNTDLGFQRMQQNISQSSMTSTGFLRSDAALAVIVLTNGEDVSGVSWVDRGDGYYIIDYNSSTTQNSFTSYKNYFSGLKPANILSKFYAVAANGGTCYGSSSFDGKRYKDMANQVNGRAYDLCSGGLSNVLNDISSHLQVLVQAIKFNYVVINEEPIVGTIVVKKNGGVVPNSSVDGWQYIGYLNNQPTSYDPALGNYKTGYFIKLNGSYVYKGTDIVTVDFQRK